MKRERGDSGLTWCCIVNRYYKDGHWGSASVSDGGANKHQLVVQQQPAISQDLAVAQYGQAMDHGWSLPERTATADRRHACPRPYALHPVVQLSFSFGKKFIFFAYFGPFFFSGLWNWLTSLLNLSKPVTRPPLAGLRTILLFFFYIYFNWIFKKL